MPQPASKILYLVHRVPYPPNRGDRIRSYHLLRFLAARHEVHLACLADEPVTADQQRELNRLCGRVAIVPLGRSARWGHAAWSLARRRSATEGLFYSGELIRTVENWLVQARYDAAVAYCSSMVPYLDVAGVRGVPAIVDLVDVDSQKWFDYAAVAHGWRRRLFELEGRRVRTLEQRAASRAVAMTVVSEPEAALCRRHCPDADVRAVPNGVDLDYFGQTPQLPPIEAPRGPQCVFVGALDYRANVDGITWFCRHVWPEVLRTSPEAVLWLVGRKPVAAVQQLSTLPGIRVAADVPDVRPYLSCATVVVVPLRVARGIQNKLLEALAARKPVVASSQAIEGLDLEPGVHACQADSPAEWIDTLKNLFADAAARQQLSHSGRQFVEQHHSWDVQLEPFEQLIQPRQISAAVA